MKNQQNKKKIKQQTCSSEGVEKRANKKWTGKLKYTCFFI